eukprot:GHVN01052609.1.p1 GENE.GHVN01052609.1~~GHVN01052609.1.p1  ORF type:complete len:659 (+),score=80.38 GHVN01052609.1:271-1977(+)
MPMSIEPPSGFALVGGYKLKTIARPFLNVDVAVEMASHTLDKRDYLDFAYSDKRAAFVGEMYRVLKNDSHLEAPQPDAPAKKHRKAQEGHQGNAKSKETTTSSKLGADVFLSTWEGDKNKPFIVLQLKDTAGVSSRWSVRILPVIRQECFPLGALGPSRNCQRESVDDKPKDAVSRQQRDKLPPTPMYNGSILEDIRMRDHSQLLERTASCYRGYREACVILKSWAFQQGLLGSPPNDSPATKGTQRPYILRTGCNSFVLSMLLAHLCATNDTAARIATPGQLLSMCLSLIAKLDFTKEAVIFGQSNIKLLDDAQLSKLGLAQFYDSPDMVFNILWRAQPFIGELQTMASNASKRLSDTLIGSDPFATLFDGVHKQSELLWDLRIQVPNLRGFNSAKLRDIPELVTPKSASIGLHPIPRPSETKVTEQPHDEGDERPEDGETHLQIVEVSRPLVWGEASHVEVGNFLARMVSTALVSRADAITVRYVVVERHDDSPPLCWAPSVESTVLPQVKGKRKSSKHPVSASCDSGPISSGIGVVINVASKGSWNHVYLDKGPSTGTPPASAYR